MRSHDDRKPVTEFKFPRLQLVWTPAAAAQVKWYARLAGVAFRETPRRLHIYLSVRGALLWGSGALFSIYFGGTAALVYTWGKNPYNQITYADLVMPTHWPDLRQKRGAGLINEGIHDLRTGDYAGIFLLARGVNLCPSDPRGRMVLAEFYIRQGYIHRGLQLLEDGLAFGPPPRLYRESLFRLLAYIEDWDRALELADQLEKTLPPSDTATRHWLLVQRVAALEKLHRYDEIDRLRDAQRASPSFIVEAAWVRAQAARSRPAEALQEIARDPGRFGPHRPLSTATGTGHCCRGSGDCARCHLGLAEPGAGGRPAPGRGDCRPHRARGNQRRPGPPAAFLPPLRRRARRPDAAFQKTRGFA